MEVKERRLRVPGTLSSVRDVCDFVSEAARDAGLGEDAIFHCQLSVEEICTNIVEHGYKYNGSDKSIDVVVRAHPDHIIISIYDDAPRFNPLDLKAPDPGIPLWEREGGGWGVYFVRQYMDDVRYSFEEQRNQLILKKSF